MVPDPNTAFIDPVYKVPTLSILANVEDPVRQEVVAALRQGKRVIPVLVDRAPCRRICRRSRRSTRCRFAMRPSNPT